MAKKIDRYQQTIRDDEDLERCADYIHLNPPKQQLVDRMRDWEWSSFHRSFDKLLKTVPERIISAIE